MKGESMKKFFALNRKMKEKGFTLIELLIVVIILAVLAAIVIPQFSSSTKDAQEAALDTTLAEMRNAIELYFHQHGSVYPGANGDGTNDAGTLGAFTEQLTRYSKTNGAVNNVKTGDFKYGPYLKKQELPKNPIDNSSAVVIIKTGDTNAGDLTQTGTNAGGWWFDSVSGKFIANIAAYVTR